jgi:hypothetical protein
MKLKIQASSIVIFEVATVAVKVTVVKVNIIIEEGYICKVIVLPSRPPVEESQAVRR